MAIRLRFATLAGAIVLAASLSACGSKPGASTYGDTEGIYLKADGLVYQVQISRALNPTAIEDRPYLTGLPAGTAVPNAQQEWFGVWMRVQNDGKQSRRATDNFQITDTQHNVYRPIALNPQANPFAYQPTEVGPKAVLPDPDSQASYSPTGGELLLFKIGTSAYQNRPLVLDIMSPSAPQQSLASVQLDL